jgi:DNA-binding transcriptional regulator YdaS (Cro superfamily)
MTLSDWLTHHGVTHARTAALLGISTPYVSMLATGVRRPSLALLRRIERVTGGEVTLADFVDE